MKGFTLPDVKHMPCPSMEPAIKEPSKEIILMTKEIIKQNEAILNMNEKLITLFSTMSLLVKVTDDTNNNPKKV